MNEFDLRSRKGIISAVQEITNFQNRNMVEVQIVGKAPIKREQWEKLLEDCNNANPARPPLTASDLPRLTESGVYVAKLADYYILGIEL